MTDRVIVIFARDPQRERKRFGLGRFADRRVAAHLAQRALRCARACSDIADIVVADDAMQRGHTFEARLLSVLERVKRSGYRRVALIGADTPKLDPTDLRTALTCEKAVLGPATDGGFYLLGLDLSELDVLRGLPWCTANVEAELSGRLRDPHRLTPRQDIDDAHDAIRLLSTLREQYLHDVGSSLDNSRATVVVVPVEQRQAFPLEPRPHVSLRGPPSVA